MSVDLSEYIDALKRSITPIGGTATTATDETWTGFLVDGFWEALMPLTEIPQGCSSKVATW